MNLLDDEGAEEDVCDYYILTTDDFRQTNITLWYQNPILRSRTPQTLMLEIPAPVLAYLHDGTMRLPKGIETSGTAATKNTRQESECSEGNWSDDSSDEEDPCVVRFDDLDMWISSSIEVLGGSAFPKVNWKCPKDATWVAFNKSLRSYMPGDIYLLLKCSTYIGDVLDKSLLSVCSDLTSSSSSLSLPSLILRKWVDISPATEFRCFVIQGRLVGISQRDTTASYSGIVRERDAIIEDIHNFYRTICHEISLSHYIFDVARIRSNNVLLLDFNVFGLVSDPSLFSYKELKICFQETYTQESLSSTNGNVVTNGSHRLIDAESFGNPVFKFIDNDKMLKFRSDVNAGPTTI